MTRLTRAALAALPKSMAPGYTPEAHGIGILHLGLGAFHRAHQAAYTDDALAAEGGDWRIASVSLRSTGTVDALTAQDNLYTLIECGKDGLRSRVIGAIGQSIAAARNPGAAVEILARPEICVVTLTVTEKAYGVDRTARDCDPGHPAVAADLADPRSPKGVLGTLVEGLRRRRAAGLEAPAILSCDNLPHNGALLRAGVLGFARRLDPDLADWIGRSATFPSSMVDRITPAASAETLAKAMRLTGLEDAAAIETEPFAQWVIEDDFPLGRPAWETAGAIFVSDVSLYETMKLRMLNGAHSLIAYVSVVAGYEYVRDAMANPALAVLTNRYITAAARTVGALPGIDLDQYRADLLDRFDNPEIAHRTAQIAMDGTEKLPQRIFEPATKDPAPSFAFALAAWMRYCLGTTDSGETYDLNDPREAELRAAVEGAGRDADAVFDALVGLPALVPAPLATGTFRNAVIQRLGTMLKDGMVGAIHRELE